jgi:nucleoside-diphosphate-sugar epimerase
MTRILVTGATGVFGHRIVDRLSDAGHEVLGLTRRAAGTTVVERNGGEAVEADLLERSKLETALDGCDVDVVVHAATRLPPETKTTAEYWERNDRVRLTGAKHLLAAVGDGVEQFVFPSVVWVARQPDGSAFDETATRHPDRATQSAADCSDSRTLASRCCTRRTRPAPSGAPSTPASTAVTTSSTTNR